MEIPVMPHPVTLTEEAAEMVAETMKKAGLSEDKWLYVGVKGGGCSGLEYVLDFVDGPKHEDWFTDEQYGMKTCTDPMSAQHLKGTTIKYMNTLMESGFKFENPGATRKCGCNKSFSV